ncbi:oligosaccharide flippase family protein [Pelomonas sp. KK5]|uniref:oligosaccharide flippase family protein n=1 Tax=Pelomonas sp. KK5 TaxID=1855730 RepID=UPI00097C43C9|nr:oligosaccharide flippase family protein [Pelomonas sp. KK5]
MSRSIGRNAASNLLAGVLPALVGLLTIPYVVHGLGSEAYGLMTLVTSIIGYFALIDINVTAGSVKHIAHHHALGEQDQVSSVFSFGAAVYLLIGLAGALPIYLLAQPLSAELFKVPAAMQPLAVQTLHIAAFGFLFGQLQAYLQSVPQALLRYDVSARFEALFGILVPLSGVAVIAAGYGLRELILVRVVLSALNCLLLLLSIRRLLPTLRLRRPERAVVVGVSSFSAYSFLSRVASLSYVHADKLIIGAFVGLTPLAYYSIASTLGNRVLGMLYRVSAVMFPAASAMAASGNHVALRTLYLRMTRYVNFANAGALLLIAGFAQPLLAHWMGGDFGRNGALILQLMALAQFIDSLTNIPSLVNDGLGHPRISGSFALVRALIGLLTVYVGVIAWGINGAAAGHVASALLMTAAFVLYVHGRSIPCEAGELWRRSYVPMLPLLLGAGLLAWLVARMEPLSLIALLAAGAGASALLLAAGLRWVLLPDDRAALQARARRLMARAS